MKKAYSISIGSSERDKVVEVELLGQQVRLERRGTDGDMEEAARLFGELDDTADAFGVGGALLGFMVDQDWYTMHSVQKLISQIHKTPTGDGTGLKMTLERMAADAIEKDLQDKLTGRKVMLTSGVDRYGMFRSFWDKNYECLIADLMFGVGLPIAVHSDQGLKRVASLLVPILGRIPFNWLYPTGESQEVRTPKFEKQFKWADVVAGDCHYITKYMPDDMEDKIIVTNTTTAKDRKIFKDAGIKYIVTTTPMMDGRTFGTNMLEAGIMAATGRKEMVDYKHPENVFPQMQEAIGKLGLKPQVQEL